MFEDVFKLTSTGYQPELAENLQSEFIDGVRFSEGKKFIYNDAVDVSRRLGNLDSYERVEASMVARNLDKDISEVMALIDELADVELEEEPVISQDEYGRFDPSSYGLQNEHVQVADTVKGMRFEDRREEGFRALESEEFDFYFGNLDDEKAEEVAVMASPVVEGLSQNHVNSKNKAVDVTMRNIEDSEVYERFNFDPLPSQIINTFYFLSDLGIGDMEEGLYNEDETGYVLNRLEDIQDDYGLTSTQSELDHFYDDRARRRERI